MLLVECQQSWKPFFTCTILLCKQEIRVNLKFPDLSSLIGDSAIPCIHFLNNIEGCDWFWSSTSWVISQGFTTAFKLRFLLPYTQHLIDGYANFSNYSRNVIYCRNIHETMKLLIQTKKNNSVNTGKLCLVEYLNLYLRHSSLSRM